MKAKRLMTLALVSTFGWSAGAFAVSSHEVITPTSFNESGPMTVVQADDGQQRIIIGSSEGSNTLSSISEAERSAALAYATQPGGEDVYGVGFTSAPYSISWAPVTVDSWDYYVLDTDSMTTDQLAAGEDVYFLLPGYDLLVFSNDYFGSPEDMTASYIILDDLG